MWVVFFDAATWSWVHMRVWHCKVSSHICSDPVSNVSLVHGVDIDLIGAGTWNVNVLLSSTCLHTEAEFRYFTCMVVRSSLISEIKVSSESVVSWPWNSEVLLRLLASLPLLS